MLIAKLVDVVIGELTTIANKGGISDEYRQAIKAALVALARLKSFW